MPEKTVGLSPNKIDKAIGQAGDILGMGVNVAGAISQIKDIKKRREFEQSYSLLSFDEQRRVNEQSLRAGTQQERLAILTNAVAQIKAAQASNNIKPVNNDRQLLLIALGGGLVLLVAIYMIKKI